MDSNLGKLQELVLSLLPVDEAWNVESLPSNTGYVLLKDSHICIETLLIHGLANRMRSIAIFEFHMSAKEF